MANAAFTQFNYSLFKKQVTLVAVVDIGSTGACTLEAWSPSTAGANGSYAAASATASAFTQAGTQGVASISRTSAGLYVLTLQNAYQRLLGVKVTVVSTTGIPVAPVVGVVSGGTNVTTSTGGVITLQFSAATGASTTTLVATDPGNGERLLIEISLDDSQTI